MATKKKKKIDIPLVAQTKAIVYALLGFTIGCTAIYFIVWRAYTWIVMMVAAV